MPSESPAQPAQPSQTVERIREIIVGRQLERLEGRLKRLESTHPSVVDEDRYTGFEARLESLRSSMQRLSDSVRQETEARSMHHQKEISRLASQIQQAAAARQTVDAQAAVNQLEHKVGTYMTQWQSALQNHLNQRESTLATTLRKEISELRDYTESLIARMESRLPDPRKLDAKFARIAAAAQALADSVANNPELKA